jgi:putative endonuclease
MKRQRAEQRGRAAETIAAWYLRFKGYRILARRVRTPMGEVDLIARRGGTVAFVEVKARATEAELALAIDEYRLRRVAAAVNALAPRFARGNDLIRIDVMLVAPGRWPRHLENVWHG